MKTKLYVMHYQLTEQINIAKKCVNGAQIENKSKSRQSDWKKKEMHATIELRLFESHLHAENPKLRKKKREVNLFCYMITSP